MTDNQTEHAWFHDQMAAYLAGGLDEQQRQRVAAHAAECAQCATDLEQLRKEDQAMQAAFASGIPGADFEDRIIAALRHGWTDRLIIHPAVRKAAAAVAALIILGAAGYTANTLMNRGGLPPILSRDSAGKLALAFENSPPVRSASNLRQLGESYELGDRGPELRAGDERVVGGQVIDALQRRVDLNGSSNLAGDRAESQQSNEQAQQGQQTHYFGRLGVDAKGVPQQDLYRYPANWPAITEGRDANRFGLDAAGTKGDFKPTEWYMASGTAQKQPVVKDLGGVLNVENRFAGQSRNSIYVADLPKPVDASDILPWGDTDGEGAANAGEKQAERTLVAAVPAKPQPVAQPEGKPAADIPPRATTPQANTPAQAADAAASRKIIRTGQMEFEVDSFDSAFAQISKIVGEEGGFVASTESQKLPNGKMTGSVTLRVAPERLDTLVLKLRALGELKGQKIAAQDITKQYTDLESQLRAARAMETRLLEIIKTGQGQIKDLVAAEKELGVWREKIERVEGEIRYYNNQVALSTLTIVLSEKDVKAAAFASETETRNLGIETEDVEKAYASAQELVSEYKGRIVSAVLKKLEAQQMAANITCEVAPDDAGPMTDRLKQLGNVARLESDRKTTTTDGTEPQLTSKVQRKDTRFIISLYNLANIAPRQTTNLTIASRNVEQTYAAILARVGKSAGRVVNSNLNQLKADQTAGTINFQVKTADADALLNDLRSGMADTEVLRMTSTENPDTANVSAAKRGFAIQVVSLAAVAPRETISLQLAVPGVAEAHRALSDLLGGESVQARVLTSQLSKRDSRNVTSALDFEVRRSDLPAIEKALASAGDVFGRSSMRAAESENTTDSKVRITMGIVSASDLPPRESFTVTAEVGDVEKVLGDVSAAALSYGGRSIDSRLSREPSGRVSGSLAIDVPLAKGPDLIKTIREQGVIKAIDTQKNSQVPDGKLTRARIDLSISNGEGIVAGNRGVWASIRNALGTSVAGLLWSLQLIVIGLFLIVPWAVALWAATKLLRRIRASRKLA